MDFNHDLGSIFNGVQAIDVSTLPPLGGTAGVLTITGTGAVLMTAGTVAQRPTGVAGMVRYNSDGTTLEFFNGTTWVDGGRQGTVTSVAITGSTGLTVGSSPITSSGTITLTLGTELQGLSALAANGMIARTAAGTYAARTIAGTAPIAVANGDGVSGAPTISLNTVGTPVTASFVKITTDTFGRVTATTPVVAGDITTLVDNTYVNASGDTVTGTLTFTGGATITGIPSPTNGSDVTNKNYVDAAVQGLSWKQSVRVATVAAGTLATSFANGSVVDGVTLVTGDRILIKNQATQSENGIYTVNASGAPTRAIDADTGTDLVGASVFVDQGSLADTGWVQTTNAPITIGSSNIVFAQFSGAGAYTAGTGLTLTGNTFSLTSPVATTLGGTGLGSIGSANQILGVNTGATGLEYKTVTAGTGISITPSAGAITIANTGVTSVALSLPSFLTVSGSPVTTTGTLTATLASQTANTVFAAPNGSAGAPTFRALVSADIAGLNGLRYYTENSTAPTNAPTAASTGAVAIGDGAAGNITGLFAVANGRFTANGDAQSAQIVLRNSTTTAAVTQLFIDGTATQLVVPNNSVVTFSILVAARRTDAVGGGAGYKFEGVIRKDATAGSTTFTGTPSKVILGETNGVWDAAVVADTTGGALRINVTGEAAKTIRWVATVMATVVTN